MTKNHPKIALTFFVVGTLLLVVMGCLIALGNTLPGGGGHSGFVAGVVIVLLPYVCYFACGIIASLFSKRTVRKGLAITGHFFPFVAILFELYSDEKVVFLIVNCVIFVPFGFAWHGVLRKPVSGVGIANNLENAPIEFP